MTDDNSKTASEASDKETNVDMDDLDAFEDAFFDRKSEPKVEVEDEAPEDEVNENEDDALETDEDTDADETEESTEDDEPEEAKAKPKGKKSFQNRIDELTADKYESKREIELLRAEIEKLKVRPEEKTELREQLPKDAPSPDAVNDKGEPVYPLGEFDPRFIRDLTKFTYEEEAKAADEKRQKETEEQKAADTQRALTASWNDKLAKAEEDIPDIREGITELTPLLTKIDPGYGDYLAATVMQCENGPEVMYYLSQNIGEAQKIVASGAFAATLAIGRLDAQFSKSNPKQEVKRNTPKVSEAPKPAEARAKGRGSSTVVREDTDDLDAFEKLFFKK